MCIRDSFYTGAAPNQQAIPAVEYLMSKDGGSAKRWVLLGTDYVYPRTTNKILRAFLTVSYTHLRAHETVLDLVCRLLLEKKKNSKCILEKHHNIDEYQLRYSLRSTTTTLSL